jgi:hypothetical protein
MSVKKEGKLVSQTCKKETLEWAEDTLSSWVHINSRVAKTKMDEINLLLFLEATGKNRKSVLARLISRRAQLVKNQDHEEFGLPLPKRATQHA